MQSSSNGIKTLDQYIDKMELSKEKHMPGHNYMGPGTNVAQKISKGIKPANYGDFIAMQHDIDYLKNAGKDVRKIDLLAAASLLKQPTLPNVVAAITLAGKAVVDTVYDTQMNTSITGLTLQETREVGDLLQQKAPVLSHYKDYSKGNLRGQAPIFMTEITGKAAIGKTRTGTEEAQEAIDILKDMPWFKNEY
jgi:hypothetical protein